MPDNAEYNNLVYRRNTLQTEISSLNSEITTIRSKVKRLRQAMKTVSQEKSNFKKTKKNTKKCVEDDYTWTGKKYSDFLDKGSELDSESENYYKYQLDRIEDELNNEITYLENIILKKLGLIGTLSAEVNSLITKIENFFN